jgi:hypothetical protein
MFANPALVPRKLPSVELVSPPTYEEISQAAIEHNEDVMGPRLERIVGKAVTVVGKHHLCGFRGVVQWCNETREVCGVRLEANSQPIIISPRFLSLSATRPQT